MEIKESVSIQELFKGWDGKENPHKEVDWGESVGKERWWENEDDNNAALVLNGAYYFVLEDENDEFYDKYLK